MEFGPFKAVVDCGMHPKRMGFSALPELSKVMPESLDFIAITHSHLDHCGALPVLSREQNRAQIMASEDGRDLLLRMLKNSRNVMAKQREEFDIKEYPLFDFSAIDALKPRVISMPYCCERRFESCGESVEVSFWPAGHIPGAASVMFEYRRRRILFTGDMSFHDTGVLKGAKPPQGKVDVLVVETTRGSHERPEGTSYESEAERLILSISRALRDGGSVLIPAFALGRMQEILFLIRRAKDTGKIAADTPVFAGGLGLDIAEHFIKGSRRSSLFSFGKQHMEGVLPLRTEIVPGRDFDTKGIYVLGSGMMLEHTPSYQAAAAMIEQRQNAVFFVGYADTDTPAYKLYHTPGGAQFAFRDLFYTGSVNCRIDKFDLSAHADRDEMLRFILELDPRCVILTHGEQAARDWFMDELIDLSPKTEVIIPNPSESFDI